MGLPMCQHLSQSFFFEWGGGEGGNEGDLQEGTSGNWSINNALMSVSQLLLQISLTILVNLHPNGYNFL